MKKIRVFLADDHAVVRDGLRALLEAEEDIDIVGDAGNGRDAVHFILALNPDLVLMDLAMPELNGIDAIQQITERLPEIKVVVLTMHSGSDYVFRAFKAGARGYLLKESAGRELVNAVRTVSGGNRYIGRRIAEIMVDDYVYHHAQISAPIERLSMREREVMQLVVEGKSSAEIAVLLRLSAKTVETYRSRLMQKLELSDIAGLVKLAIACGMIVLD